MVLKALFIGSRLAPIKGLDERANPELAQILREYAHERWSAGRPVNPELWRCVGPFATSADALADLERRARGRGGGGAGGGAGARCEPGSGSAPSARGQP